MGEFRLKAAKWGGLAPGINTEVAELIKAYEKKSVNLERILEFHVRFERIRPFDDYNGGVGRIIMMKECLRHGIMPFIIDDKHRGAYNDRIAQWDKNSEILITVCTEAQKRFEHKLDTCRLMQYHRSE